MPPHPQPVSNPFPPPAPVPSHLPQAYLTPPQACLTPLHHPLSLDWRHFAPLPHLSNLPPPPPLPAPYAGLRREIQNQRYQ